MSVAAESDNQLYHCEMSGRSKSSVSSFAKALHRPRKQGEWRIAASWMFCSFLIIFSMLLLLKLVTNNVSQESPVISSTTKGDSPSTTSSSYIRQNNKDNPPELNPPELNPPELNPPDLSTDTINIIEPTIEPPKPNFIFILSDDIGYGAINNPEFPFTPYLTSLAQDSLRLTNYYSQELCAPARAALLTGRYPIRLGLQFGQLLPTLESGLPLQEILLPEILHAYGNYQSYALGKWNLGHHSPDYLPTARGFDYYLGYLTTQNTYWTKSMAKFPGIRDFLEATKDGYKPYTGDDIHTYSTHLYRDHAIQIIQSHNYTQHPMFLYLAFQAAHPPFTEIHEYTSGLTNEYFHHDLYQKVMNFTSDFDRQQYV
jgi:hypothetical protein